MQDIETKEINIMGLPLTQWKYKSCMAHFAETPEWVTLYDIRSEEEGKGHAIYLLTQAKEYYKDRKFGGSIALNDRMKRLYQKLEIEEYTEEKLSP